MPNTLMVIVGNHKNSVVQAIKLQKDPAPSHIVLVAGKGLSGLENIAAGVAEAIGSELRPYFDVSIHRINGEDIMSAAREISEIILEERVKGNNVIVNVASEFYSLSLGAYIAASLTKSKIVASIIKYQNEFDFDVLGISEVIALPRYPFGEERRKILLNVEDEGKTSLEEIINKINPDLTKSDKSKYSSERSRLIHHFKKLEDLGFITKVKEGKYSYISLTKLGQIMKLIFQKELKYIQRELFS